MEQVHEDGYFIDWSDVRELRRMIEQDGVPRDPSDLRAQFVAMVRNAEGLFVLFGHHWDEGARRECYALFEAIRATTEWEQKPTHRPSTTRH